MFIDTCFMVHLDKYSNEFGNNVYRRYNWIVCPINGTLVKIADKSCPSLYIFNDFLSTGFYY